MSAETRQAMTGKLIYVDMDDVLCETAANLCRLAEREFGRHVEYEDVFAFDLQKVFALSNDEMSRFMIASHAPGALLTHPVTPGAPEALRALRDAGHSVEIVTGRPAYAHGDTERWLAAAGIGDFPVTYVDKYGRDKSYAHNEGDPPTVKLDELLARKFDVVIDDSPQILELLSGWKDTRILVFSRPWNASFALSANMTRVGGWRDILAALR